MTLYDRMISQAESLEQSAIKARDCSPQSAKMVGCSEYFRRCAEEIKSWAKDICIECGEKEQ